MGRGRSRPTPARGAPRAATPGQGTLVAPWYQLPARPASPPAAAGRRSPGRRRAIFLGGCLLIAGTFRLLDPAPAAEPHAAPVPAAPAMAVARFAAIDTTLGVAVAEAQMAALRAHDVALRAFAVQQAARYDALRAELRALSGGRGDVVPAAVLLDAARHYEQSRGLRDAYGPQFDHEYVRRALALNRELLAEMDAALGGIEDVELRDALRQVRGTIGATMPGGAAGTSTTGSTRGPNE